MKAHSDDTSITRVMITPMPYCCFPIRRYAFMIFRTFRTADNRFFFFFFLCVANNHTSKCVTSPHSRGTRSSAVHARSNRSDYTAFARTAASLVGSDEKTATSFFRHFHQRSRANCGGTGPLSSSARRVTPSSSLRLVGRVPRDRRTWRRRFPRGTPTISQEVSPIGHTARERVYADVFGAGDGISTCQKARAVTTSTWRGAPLRRDVPSVVCVSVRVTDIEYDKPDRRLRRAYCWNQWSRHSSPPSLWELQPYRFNVCRQNDMHVIVCYAYNNILDSKFILIFRLFLISNELMAFDDFFLLIEYR